MERVSEEYPAASVRRCFSAFDGWKQRGGDQTMGSNLLRGGAVQLL